MALRLLARNSLASSQGLPALQRAIATYAIAPAKETVASQVLHDKEESGFSLRQSTREVARRFQWQSMPIDAPKSFEAVINDANTSQARIVTEARWPYKVVYANKAWEQLCGFTAEEVVGQAGLGFMQGEETDRSAVRRINSAVREGERVSVRVVNYKRDGTPFCNMLQITPLRSRLGEYTHMLGIITEEPMQQCSTRRC